MTTWEQVQQTIAGFVSITNDWDGLDAPAPGLAAIDKARRWATFLKQWGAPPPDRVLVGVNANIFLEWEDGSEYREIEFDVVGHAVATRLKEHSGDQPACTQVVL